MKGGAFVDIYDRIAKELQLQNKSRKDLSEGTGVPYTTLSSLFQRRSKNMRLDTLKLIADYLDVSLDWLLEGGDKDQKNNDVIEEEIMMLSKRLSLKNKAKVLLYINDLLDGKE